MRGLLALVLLFSPLLLWSQVTLKGIVREKRGESLPQAHLRVLPDSIDAVANDRGVFELKLSRGDKQINASFVGFKTQSFSLFLRSDTSLLIEMEAETRQLNEVVISGNRVSQEDILQSTRSGVHVITQEEIESIPVLGGQADPIKAIQLLPGVLRGVEGSSDLFVRGGAADQNLVLLDDVPIYNTSHMLGFVSVFNPDILDKVESINGGFPADFGGRLSSVLNVQTKSDITSKTKVSGDVGLIATQLSLQQPIVKDKLSLHLAGRRTYIDQVVKAVNIELPYFFYDFNGKLVYRPTNNDEVKFSYYGGDDRLDLFRDRNNDGDGFLTRYTSGNNSQSFQWSRRHSGAQNTRISLTRSKYRYNITNIFGDNQLLAISDIEDYGTRIQWSTDSLRSGFFKAGIDWTYHAVSPGVVNTSGFLAELFEGSESKGRRMHEGALYALYERGLSSRWTVNGGLRLSSGITENKTYVLPEPRLTGRYKVDEHQAVKISYSRMTQYMHRIANSAITSPTDIWFPVTNEVKPQSSHQLAVSWQRSWPNKNIFFSAESYYKHMTNLIGYEEGTNLFFNTDFESKLIQGRGRAYGIEVLFKKEQGNLSGWISYTLSWSYRQFDALNNGNWFHSRYDRRHNGAIVAQYKLHPRWAVSGVWEFISGSRFTPVLGQYLVLAPSLIGADVVPVYSGINQVSLSNTHRLDLGLKYKSRHGSRYQWEWFAGVYNTYNRANPIGLIIEPTPQGSLRYIQPGLFGLIPFISYGFKF